MNIQILDSHLREYLKTKATPLEIAENLSRSSVSVERVLKKDNDFLYDIEITTNRPDLASVVSIAREAGAVLTQNGIQASFTPPKFPNLKTTDKKLLQVILNKHVERAAGFVMDVKVKKTPEYIVKRLETAGIRSLNNLIDITNYIMITLGQPTHVFDYDRLQTKNLTLREAKTGEQITTLDGKTYILRGGELVADNGREIVDLLGIMGLANSVVTPETKRAVFFIDENDPWKIRQTSMNLGIRTEAAVLNEKGINPYLAEEALKMAASLYEDLAEGKILHNFDYFPNPPQPQTVSVNEDKISSLIGVKIPIQVAAKILNSLDFKTKITNSTLAAIVPTARMRDIKTAEDLIEEIARIYGYHNIPSLLPPFAAKAQKLGDEFYWETRIKTALKYWGFTEVYTYSMVSESLYEGPLENAVTISNPLNEDLRYMRCSLVMSLLQVVNENKTRENLKIFELANVYLKNTKDLPKEKRLLAGVLKKPRLSFFEVKGLLEQLTHDLGIAKISLQTAERQNQAALIYVGKDKLGEIEILDKNIIDFELDFDILLKHANLKKTYHPLSKYPAVFEDMAFLTPREIPTEEIIKVIQKQSNLITETSLLDRFEDTRTFHVVYQNPQANLNAQDIKPLREKIIRALKEKFNIKPKE